MSFETIWAGWRNDYVVSATESERTGEDDACVFCRIAASGDPSPDNGVVWRGRAPLVVLNLYPYASGHLLAMQLRHLGDLEELDAAEAAELWDAVRASSVALRAAYAPDGINIGANLGRAAGAGIPAHLHLHALPRWSGDTNFMTSVAGARVIPASLPVAWQKLHAAWPDA